MNTFFVKQRLFLRRHLIPNSDNYFWTCNNTLYCIVSNVCKNDDVLIVYHFAYLENVLQYIKLCHSLRNFHHTIQKLWNSRYLRSSLNYKMSTNNHI